MKDLQKVYRNFHDELKDFLDQLETKFYPTTPAKLKNVKFLPLIFTPESNDFKTTNIEKITKKIKHVFKVIKELEKFLKNYIDPSDHDWLNYRFSNLKSAMTNIEEWIDQGIPKSASVKAEESDQYEEMKPGLVGANTQITTSRDEIRESLRAVQKIDSMMEWVKQKKAAL